MEAQFETVRELLIRYQASHDPVLRQELFLRHHKLVHHVVRKFACQGEPFEDLLQVGSIGLLRAMEHFRPASGTAFATYAVPTILGTLRHHVRDHGWHLKIPRHLKQISISIDQACRTEENRGRTAPNRQQLAKQLRETEARIEEASGVSNAQAIVSLDTSGPEQGVLLVGFNDPGYECVENRMALREALAALKRRERLVIFYRFYCNMTQAEISRLLHVTPVAVSRIQARGLDKMRACLAEAA